MNQGFSPDLTVKMNTETLVPGDHSTIQISNTTESNDHGA